MPAVQQTVRRRISLATLLILSLSILLHLALLRTVTGSGSGQIATSDPVPGPVVVHLQPVVRPAPPPPVVTPKPAKPVARRKPVPPAAPVLAHAEAASPDTLPAPEEAIGSAAQSDAGGLAADTPAADQLELPLPEQEAKPPLRASPPPPALLHYSVEARRSDGNYQGTGTIRFARDDSGYSVQGEVKLMFLSLLSFESSGEIVEQGLAPVLYTEKRFRKPSTNTHFQRERQLVSFSASTASYARSGTEQDRASIVWQLAALGRGDATQLAPGTEVAIFVAGTRDGETWHLQVTGEEELFVAGRKTRAIRVLRLPRPGSYEQRLDIWLAPDLQWYPVKLRFTESSGDQLDLSLTDMPDALAGN